MFLHCKVSADLRPAFHWGGVFDRQKGSHVMMVKEGYAYTLSIPQHRELGIGLIR